jgi:hypothetical protein
MTMQTLAQRLALMTTLAGAALSAQAITGATPTTAFEGVGRGVQVAPDWVLTAYHFAFGVGQTYSNGFGSRTVAARYDAPGSGPLAANDLTLLRLAPAATSAPFMPILDIAVPVGTFAPWNVTMVSAANSGPARGFAFSTVSESMLMADPDDAGPLPPVVVNWLVSWDTVVHVQGGDSGGALFAGHVANSGLLLGIASALFEDDLRNPLGSAFVQPAAYRAWIDSTMAADGADNQTLLWTAAAVPEPRTWALLATGLVLLGWRLGKRQPTPAHP